jgi:CRP-like cAMP-binding protein
MWVETLVDGSIQREWTANVGRRNARARIAHLLCEIGLRVEAAGVAERRRYDLPLTQEQLGDATGLTAVHVNRVLQALTSDGVIGRDKRSVEVQSWERLAEVGDFRSSYLHPMDAAL